MSKKFNYLITLFIIIMMVIFYGCTAVQIGGELVRSGQEDFELILSPGITSTDISSLNNVAVSVNGFNQNGAMVIGFGENTNANMYTDLFTMELIKQGYNATSLSDNTADVIKVQKITELDSAGYQMIFICNTSLSSTSSVIGGLTGGEYANLGVQSFTFKGIRTSDNKTLFICSGQYGKTKNSSEVVKDIGTILKDINKGNIKKYQEEEN